MPKGGSKVLTEAAAIRIKKPAAGRVDVFDAGCPGLALRIGEDDRRTWTVFYRVGKAAGRRGRPAKGAAPVSIPTRPLRRFTIGTFKMPGTPDIVIPLATARMIAGEVKAFAAQGRDYVDVLLEREQAKAKSDETTFQLVAEKFIDAYAKNRQTSWRETERAIKRHMLPQWAKRPVRSITRDDLVQMRDAAAKHGGVASNRALAKAKVLFRWASEENYIDVSPFVGKPVPKVGAETVRERVLEDHEIRAVWDALKSMGRENPDDVWPYFGRLLFYTAQRRTAVATLQWKVLNLDTRRWTRPPSATKNAKRLVIPLTDEATNLLKTVRAIGNQSDFVFPSGTGATPISAFGDFKARLDKASGVTDWTLHDIRRTVATTMGERLGIHGETIKLCLGHHVKKDGALGHYDHSTKIEERLEAFTKWTALLNRIVEGKGVVVDLEGARA